MTKLSGWLRHCMLHVELMNTGGLLIILNTRQVYIIKAFININKTLFGNCLHKCYVTKTNSVTAHRLPPTVLPFVAGRGNFCYFNKISHPPSSLGLKEKPILLGCDTWAPILEAPTGPKVKSISCLCDKSIDKS